MKKDSIQVIYYFVSDVNLKFKICLFKFEFFLKKKKYFLFLILIIIFQTRKRKPKSGSKDQPELKRIKTEIRELNFISVDFN